MIANQPGEQKAISSPKSGYIPSLDGWRAIAVSLVIMSHIPIRSRNYGYLIHFVGTLGVDLFFAISGILICSRLLDEELRHGSISLKGFYIRRTFRIFPPLTSSFWQLL